MRVRDTRVRRTNQMNGVRFRREKKQTKFRSTFDVDKSSIHPVIRHIHRNI